MPLETIAFFVLAFIGIASAIMMITRTSPMNSALSLIVNFIALAGIYLTLHAQFVAIIQILVYTGAIMVLVLFVIMLLNLQDEARLKEFRTWKQYVGIAFSAMLLVLIIQPVASISGAAFGSISDASYLIGTVESIGAELYTNYLFPFELTSLLLLVAIVGAVLLAKKRFP